MMQMINSEALHENCTNHQKTEEITGPATKPKGL